MYLAIPMTLYACERLLRAFRPAFKPVRILKVHFQELPSPSLFLTSLIVCASISHSALSSYTLITNAAHFS